MFHPGQTLRDATNRLHSASSHHRVPRKILNETKAPTTSTRQKNKQKKRGPLLNRNAPKSAWRNVGPTLRFTFSIASWLERPLEHNSGGVFSFSRYCVCMQRRMLAGRAISTPTTFMLSLREIGRYKRTRTERKNRKESGARTRARQLNTNK